MRALCAASSIALVEMFLRFKVRKKKKYLTQDAAGYKKKKQQEEEFTRVHASLQETVM